MTRTGFHFVPVPGAAWSSSDPAADLPVREFRQCLADARAIEARIEASPDQENDMRRYTAACRRLEVLAEAVARAVAGGSPPLPIRIGAAYGDVVETLLADRRASGRFAATFFAPDEIAAQTHAIEAKAANQAAADAVEALREIAAMQAGLVIMPVEHAALDSRMTSAASPVVSEAAGHQHAPVDEPEALLLERESRSLAQSLRSWLAQALAGGPGGRVAIGALPDRLITETLNSFVYAPQPASSFVPVFPDGSHSGPFPVHCRARSPRAASPGPLLRAALISMRHLALDPEVDMAWFRNRDVSRARRAAETEEFCFRATLDALAALRCAAPLTIHLYQTGLPPAVVGFYRAVVETLNEWEAGLLTVVPYYFRFQPGGPALYVAGTPWT